MTIHDACHGKAYDKVLDIIKNDATAVNQVDQFGQTPLHAACTVDANDNILDLLITLQRNLNIRDHDGYTPLLRAAASGKVDNVRILTNILDIDRNATTPKGMTYKDLLRMARKEGDMNEYR